MIRISCTSCQKPLSIDETKLPMREVSFPCPGCKTKLTVDRRKLGQSPAPLVAPTTIRTSDSAAATDDDEFGEKALLIGNDTPALRQALKAIGKKVVHFATAEAAREFFLQEYPPIVMFAPAQLTAPPVADMAPMLQIVPADRRKSFFVLVADNLRTLDGNAAFLYNMNMVVATRDLGSFEKVFRDADAFHQRLYTNVTALSG